MNDVPVAYQVISRNNDVNGNPFRLILVYNAQFTIIKAVESRSSMPNYVSDDCANLTELPSFHLNPKQYNDLVSHYKELGILSRYY